MSKVIDYSTKGTCCRLMRVTVTDNGENIENVEFLGGCHGNLQGIAALVRDQKIKDVIDRLEGIRCGDKDTSCPDQLCKALRSLKEA